VALSTERGVLVVIGGETEGGSGQVAIGRAELGRTARSGRSETLEPRGGTHRLLRADVDRQLGGSGRPAGSDMFKFTLAYYS